MKKILLTAVTTIMLVIGIIFVFLGIYIVLSPPNEIQFLAALDRGMAKIFLLQGGATIILGLLAVPLIKKLK